MEVYDLKELKLISKNSKNILKKISLSILLFSIIFSFALFFMSKIVFLGYVSRENYMDKIFLIEFSILIILVPISYFLLYILEKHYNKISNMIVQEKEFKNKNLFCLIAFIFLFSIYIIYFLSSYPGGIYIDTWSSYSMLTGEEEFTNKQPVLYTLMLNVARFFSSNLFVTFGIFTFIQISFMAITFTYFIYWLLSKKVNSIVVTFITIFFGIFKLYPLYSISIWKDTPFSLVLFLFTLTVIDLIIDFKNKNIRISNIIKFNIYSILISFLRTNGVFTIIPFVILIITFIKDIKNTVHIKSFCISVISIFIIIYIIQSLYPLFGIITTSTTEKAISIPIQQVARVISVDGNITNEQKEKIEKIIPLKKAKKIYRSMLADKIRWDSEFNEEYLQEHLGDYFKLWFELLIQNPSEYVIAYLLQTSGFWSFNVKGAEAYVSPTTWETLNNKIFNLDLIAEFSDNKISYKKDLLTYPYYSGGTFFWITLISMLFTFKSCEKKYLIGYLPAILLWFTVVVATPMAQALRYVYILVLILPLNFVYPAIMKKEYYEKNNS